MDSALLHYYRQARAWQMKTYSKDGLFIDGVDQRQYTGGGAAYGFHAYAAYLSAKRSIHFRQSRGMTA